MFKVGDKVELKRNHLWANKGARGIVTAVHTSWDDEDVICWDLTVFFHKSELSTPERMGKWFGKDAGMHNENVQHYAGR